MVAGNTNEGDGRSMTAGHVARAAHAQSLSREVNERILHIPDRPPTVYEIFICECSLEACIETVSLTVEEYEAVRRHPARFVVQPGHVDRGVEYVVDSAAGRYEVVEKINHGGELARDLDPHTYIRETQRHSRLLRDAL
jgi:hypothetical protein